MIDLLFQFALNNVFISLVLAVAAAIAGITLKRPAITYLLWLLVFLKLLTPPVMSIPVLPGSWMDSTVLPFNSNLDEQRNIQEPDIRENAGSPYLSTSKGSTVPDQGKTWLFLAWLLGSTIVFLWSLLHVYRFNRLLGKESEAGPHKIQSTAAEIASCLGIRAVPIIYTTSANLSPMVWWTGGKVRVVIPTALIQRMDTKQIRWILSHELAHVRRRDYVVRWIEWLACVCFWWNPVSWWARKNLRANEELCCDALVLSCLKPSPSMYGDSLLEAIEILAFPARRPPVMASGINGGALLKRRVRMIVSKNINRSSLRWLQACILLGALFVLPLGLTKAQDSYENTPHKIKEDSIELQETKADVYQIQEALESGEISEQEADARLAVLEQQVARKYKFRLMELDNEIARKEAALENLSETYTPDHPEAIRLRKELDQLIAQRQKTSTVNIYRRSGAPASPAPPGSLNVPYPGVDYQAVLKAAVADGMITEEYVEDKLVEMENAQYERFERSLAEAVAAGKISEEQAAKMAVDYKNMLETRRAKRQLNGKN